MHAVCLLFPVGDFKQPEKNSRVAATGQKSFIDRKFQNFFQGIEELTPGLCSFWQRVASFIIKRTNSNKRECSISRDGPDTTTTIICIKVLHLMPHQNGT